MAEDKDVVLELCVNWTTNLPTRNRDCQSDHICIRQDSSWFLELCLDRGCYELYLCNEMGNYLRKPLTVTTTIRVQYDCDSDSDSGDFFLNEVTTVRKSDLCLWSMSKRDFYRSVDSYFDVSEISIICVFHNCLGSKKRHFKTQTDFAPTSCSTVTRDLQTLSRDFSSFMKDETFSDVTLKCGDCTFSAHKSVLAARSEVFATMFRIKMMETNTGVVDIQDMDPGVLEQLIKYMYSGEKPDLRLDTARPLYEAADKYAVYALKKTCSEYMVADLTQENCLELLVLADVHTDEDFKDAISRFIGERLHLFSRECWSTFKAEHSELAVAVLEKRFAGALSGQI